MRTLPITVAADADYPSPACSPPPRRRGPLSRRPAGPRFRPSGQGRGRGPNRPFRGSGRRAGRPRVASLRDDKRTFAHGKRLADALQGRLSVEEEVIRDALCAAALLRAEPLIRPDRVYLLGHSMGGMLAPRIDAEGGAFAGLIFWAGTSPHSGRPDPGAERGLSGGHAPGAARRRRASGSGPAGAVRRPPPHGGGGRPAHPHSGEPLGVVLQGDAGAPPEEYLRRLTKPRSGAPGRPGRPPVGGAGLPPLRGPSGRPP